MLQPARIDIDVHRNAVFAQEFELFDDGEAVDITGATLAAEAKSHAGQDTQADATLAVTDGPAGKFSFSWDGADFDDFGSTSETVLLVYDLKMVLDGASYIIAYGCINLIPGITA